MGGVGAPASTVSEAQPSCQEIQGSARTPVAQARDFSRAQEFPGSWCPSPRSRRACPVIPRDGDDILQLGKARLGCSVLRATRSVSMPGVPCPAHVGKHAGHLTPRYIESSVFMTFRLTVPLYNHGARILCRFKERKLSSLPAAGERCLAQRGQIEFPP